jgi:hypothetical protein
MARTRYLMAFEANWYNIEAVRVVIAEQAGAIESVVDSNVWLQVRISQSSRTGDGRRDRDQRNATPLPCIHLHLTIDFTNITCPTLAQPRTRQLQDALPHSSTWHFNPLFSKWTEDAYSSRWLDASARTVYFSRYITYERHHS